MKKKKQSYDTSGFALIVIILTIAIIGIIASMYYVKRISKAQQAKKQIEEQTEQIEKKVEDQMQELQKKSIENINNQTVPKTP